MSSSCWEYAHGHLFKFGGLFRSHTIKETRIFLAQKPPVVNIFLGMGYGSCEPFLHCVD